MEQHPIVYFNPTKQLLIYSSGCVCVSILHGAGMYCCCIMDVLMLLLTQIEQIHSL